MKKAALLILLTLITTTSLAENTLVKMQTTEGDIYFELYNDKAPHSVKNFLSYAQDGFYNGTVFHRVISTFMIQGGGFDESLLRKQTSEPIENEASNGVKNKRGTIAMARLSEPHSATAQFFINVQDNATLDYTNKENIEKITSNFTEKSKSNTAVMLAQRQYDIDLSKAWGYAVFGHVVKGMDVVDNIRFKPTAGKKQIPSDVPVINVVIQSVELVTSLPE